MKKQKKIYFSPKRRRRLLPEQQQQQAVRRNSKLMKPKWAWPPSYLRVGQTGCAAAAAASPRQPIALHWVKKRSRSFPRWLTSSGSASLSHHHQWSPSSNIDLISTRWWADRYRMKAITFSPFFFFLLWRIIWLDQMVRLSAGRPVFV